MKSWWKWLWNHRNIFIVILTPIFLLPLPLVVPTSESRCGFAIIVMVVYWCTECLPLAVTSLLPVVLFPMMGIMKAGEKPLKKKKKKKKANVSGEYLNDTNMLLIGGLLVAIAVEHWNLHKRIALKVLLLVGVRPSLLMMGFMMVSSFLSMWISNISTTAMMMPIAAAVLQQLRDTETDTPTPTLDNQAFQMEVTPEREEEEVTDGRKAEESKEGPHPDLFCSKGSDSSDSRQENRRKMMEEHERFNKGVYLSVCYSASIGGTATLTGTTPNIIMKGQIDKIFPDNGDVINFATWFGFAFPNMVIMLIFTFLWLQFLFLGCNLKQTFGCGEKNNGDNKVYAVIKEQYAKLERMKFAEGAVLALFVLLVVLWFTRAPGFVDGWATLLFNKEDNFVSDGTVAVFVSMLFFLVPSRLPKFGGYNDNGKLAEAPPTLLTWQQVHQRMPWDILLLLGGGFALAAGSEASGLSRWLGSSLSPLEELPPFAISILLSMLVAAFTEFSTNVATATLFMPVLGTMATAIKIHPFFLMLPCTIACSLAFMLPVATVPNAMAMSFGDLRVMDMVKAGFMLNVIGIVTTNVGVNTWGYLMFDMGTFPQWANITPGRP